MNGLELLKILKKKHKYLEVIILTGYGGVNSAVEAIKLGLQMVSDTENWENAVMANALLYLIETLEEGA